jgi:hypothetical protein
MISDEPSADVAHKVKYKANTVLSAFGGRSQSAMPDYVLKHRSRFRKLAPHLSWLGE